jgi:hypothetical protein
MDSLRVDIDRGAGRNPVLSSIDVEGLYVRSSGLGDEGDRAVETKGLELGRVRHYYRTKNWP